MKLVRITFSLLLLGLCYAVSRPSASVSGIDGDNLNPTGIPFRQSADANRQALFYWRPGGVWTIDPETLEDALFYTYDPPPNYHLVDIALDPVAHYLYVVEGEGDSYLSADSFNNISIFVQIDLNTRERIVLGEYLNFEGVSLSPKGTYALVRFRDEFTEKNHYRPDSLYCVFEISAKRCDSIEIQAKSVHWLDENLLLYELRPSSETVVLLDVRDFQQQEITFSGLTSMDVVPKSRTILGMVFEENRLRFTRFDFSDSKHILTTEVNHEPRLFPIWRMSASNSGDYFLYSSEDTYVVVNTSTGEYFVVNIPLPADESWFPSKEGFIVLSRIEDNLQERTYELVYVDASTGDTNMVSRFTLASTNRSLLVSLP